MKLLVKGSQYKKLMEQIRLSPISLWNPGHKLLSTAENLKSLYSQAKTFSNSYLNPKSEEEKLKSDAMRHILASAYFTNKIGRRTTEFLGWSNEFAGALKNLLKSGEFDSGWVMDDANNKIGMEIGSREGITRSEIENEVKKVIDSGDFFLEDGKTKFKNKNLELENISEQEEEEEELPRLESTDYTYIFMSNFKKWLDKKFGEKYKDYPFSYLVNYFFDDFIKDMGLSFAPMERGDWRVENLIRQAGGELHHKKIHPYVDVFSRESFLKKYGKAIKIFKDRLNIPDYQTVTIEEPKRGFLEIRSTIKFPERLFSDKPTITKSKLEEEFEEFFSDYMGLKFGKDIWGEYVIKAPHPQFIGLEEWINDFRKTIRPKLKKEIPEFTSKVHSIKFENEERGLKMIVVFKSGVMGTNKVLEGIREFMRNLGYKLRITDY